MMSLYEKRPGKEASLEILQDSEEEMPDNVKFKQWVLMGSAEMVTIITFQDEYS